jgi:hypothetical protein
MNVNKRINELAEKFFSGNNVRFAEFLSTSEANIRNYRSNKEPKLEILNRIVDKLEISYEWLLTGKGQMLKSDTNDMYNVEPSASEPAPGPAPVSVDFAFMLERYEKLARENERLKAEIQELKKRNIRPYRNDLPAVPSSLMAAEPVEEYK